jgi:drug/metabolite transporter (DMT)-like permease
MGVGMGLLLWALSLGDVGAVGVLSSISPVMVLPLLWWKFKRIPAWGAWLGAALAVSGTALMLTR